MIKVLFVCHGNICRSPMAEFVLKDMVNKQGREHEFYIASAATSTEEIGNPVHRGTRKKLASVGISTDGKYAVQMKRSDYDKYDYLIGMDDWNIRNMLRITGGDPEHKIYRLLEFADRSGEIADPWYTGDFDETYRDVLDGCEGFLAYLREQGKL
jgi:protein-tyrosine phosphatase